MHVVETPEELNALLSHAAERMAAELAQSIDKYLKAAFPEHPGVFCTLKVNFEPTIYWGPTASNVLVV